MLPSLTHFTARFEAEAGIPMVRRSQFRRGQGSSPPCDFAEPPEGAENALHKNWHYAFVVSLLTILTCTMALLNAYLHFINVSSYSPGSFPGALILAGYLGMFLTMWISPIPDYVLVPAYGYLCAIGVFGASTTFLVCLVAAILPIEYAAGRYAGRRLLLKGLSYFRITEGDILVADNWLVNHGRFSIFAATFIPFFYSVAGLAAGALKMKATPFLVFSSLGFGLRYVFLEYVGFYGVHIFTALFDYSYRAYFVLLLILSSVYAGVHLFRAFRSGRGRTT